MPVSIFGCGKMGKAVAFYLASLGQNEINLVDVDYNSTVLLRNYLLSHFQNLKISLNDTDALSQSVLCLPWRSTYSLLKDIFKKSPGAKVTSITRPNDRDVPTLKELRKSYDFLLPCGVEPGLTELLPTYLINKYHDVTSVSIFCGGLVDECLPPLSHGLLFGSELSLSNNTSFYIMDKIISATSKLEGKESLFIPGVGALEAYHDGMMFGFAEYLQSLSIERASQKTLRYPGNIDCMKVLRDLGLLNDKAAAVPGHPDIVPKKWISDYLVSCGLLSIAHKDRTILQVRCGGVNEKNHTLVSSYNNENDNSGMGVITGFTAAYCSMNFFHETKKIREFYPFKYFNCDFTQGLLSSMLSIDSIYSTTSF